MPRSPVTLLVAPGAGAPAAGPGMPCCPCLDDSGVLSPGLVASADAERFPATRVCGLFVTLVSAADA